MPDTLVWQAAVNEPLRPPQAKKLILAILEEGTFEVSDHAEEESPYV